MTLGVSAFTTPLSQIWLNAQIWTAAINFPVIATYQAAQDYGTGMWFFDQTSPETIATELYLPSYWQTFDLDIYTVNTNGGTGNVVFKPLYTTAGSGDSLNSITTGSNTTIAIAAQHVVTVTTLATGLSYTNTKLQRLAIRRQADNGSDTYANDYAMWGVLLRRAT